MVFVVKCDNKVTITIVIFVTNMRNLSEIYTVFVK